MSVAAIVLLGAVGVTIMRRTGTSEAIREAKQVTRLVGHGTVEPRSTAAVIAGDPRALARLDAPCAGACCATRSCGSRSGRAEGRIVYSDEPRLIGAPVPARRRPAQALRTGGLDANVSDLKEPENRFERDYGKLLEVYMPIGARRPAAAVRGLPALQLDQRERPPSVALVRARACSGRCSCSGCSSCRWPGRWRAGCEGQRERETLLQGRSRPRTASAGGSRA